MGSVRSETGAFQKSMLTRFVNELRRNYRLYALAVPGLILILTFSYIPMLGHILAFKRYTFVGGLFGSRALGLRILSFSLAAGTGRLLLLTRYS